AEIGENLHSWPSARPASDAAATLSAAGIPAATVIAGRDVVFNPQLRHPGLFDLGHAPVTGDHELPGLPFRMSRVDSWVRSASPTIGQHNDEVLRELGLDDGEIAGRAD